MTGERISDAQVTLNFNRPAIDIRFDEEGTRRWAEATRQAIGTAVAIALDQEVMTAPMIRESMPGGRISLTGNFTVEQAREIALLLRSGSLAVPLRLVQEQAIASPAGR